MGWERGGLGEGWERDVWCCYCNTCYVCLVYVCDIYFVFICIRAEMEGLVSRLTTERDQLSEDIGLLEEKKKEVQDQLQDYTTETSQQVCVGGWVCVRASERVSECVCIRESNILI